MPYYVCKGAKLKCSMGSEQSDLEVVHLERPVRVCGQFKASVMDHKPLMNIKPFGQCKSLANPAVAAATAANYGRPQKMPCVPNTPLPWVNGKMNVFVKGNPALLDCSKCSCAWLGVIEITDPGQKLMSCGSSGLASQEMGASPAGADNAAATPGNGLASNALSQGIASQASPNSIISQSTGAASSASTAAEPKVAEIYWSYGKDHKRLSGKSRFYSDLNLHVKTENYNDWDTVDIAIKRKDGQPLFVTAHTLDLTGTVSGNEAVLENVLKGYSLGELAEITAESSGAKASVFPGRPKWEDVYNGYPHFNDADKPVDDVFRYILGSDYDRKMFSNGGAARVSIGLIDAGMDVRKDFLVQDGSEFKKKLIQRDKVNEKKRIGFIASARNLQEWLSSVWGKADVELKGKTSIENVQSAIDGRNGVYVILGGFDSGAPGAATLWLGDKNDALGGLNYVHKGGTVYFWELRGEEISGDEEGSLFVKKVKGADKTYPRQKILYKVTKYNKEEYEMSDEDREKINNIKWDVRLGNETKRMKDREGKDITGEKFFLYNIDKKLEGHKISVIAYIEGTKKASFETNVLRDTFKGTLIRGVEGKDEAFPWQEIEYRVINSNKDGEAGEVKDGSDVKWAIKVGENGSIDKDMLKDNRGKKEIVLKMKKEWAGKEIAVMPYLNSPTEIVSVKTEVARGNLRTKLGETHYGEINKRFKKTSNSAAVFRKFENELFVNRTDVEVDDIEYDDTNGWLDLNIEADKEGVNKSGYKPFEPYERTIHEIWHNIDHLAGSDSNTFFSQTYKNELIEALKVDFLNKIEANVDAIIAGNATKEDIDKIEELMGEGINFLSFIDIIDAITIGNLNYGTHEKSYWNAFTIPAEIFANIAATEIANEEAFKEIGDKLPNTTKVYYEIIRDILNKTR